MRHSSTATVIASYGQRGTLRTDDHPNKGSQPYLLLPYLLKGRKLKPVCGDRVRWEASNNDGEALVTEVLERINVLERPDSRGGREALAANLDTLAVVVAPEPKPDFFIADRFICAAELMRANCLVVWNKTDLPAAAPPELDVYRELGYPVLTVSATSEAGLDTLLDRLGNGIGMLVGQSGVGKSSLINQLAAQADAATGHLSAASREGRHTTTASVAHYLKSGGWLADSPGIRDFVPAIAEISAIQNGYREILQRADNCRFADCRHTREPACAVLAAVENGSIDRRRYESYKRLLNLATAQADQRR